MSQRIAACAGLRCLPEVTVRPIAMCDGCRRYRDQAATQPPITPQASIRTAFGSTVIHCADRLAMPVKG